eukprot:3921000-Rhodomonas_salina.2
MALAADGGGGPPVFPRLRPDMVRLDARRDARNKHSRCWCNATDIIVGTDTLDRTEHSARCQVRC